MHLHRASTKIKILSYLIVAVLSLILVVSTYKLRIDDFTAPIFGYHGDSLEVLASVTNYVYEDYSSRMYAPFGFDNGNIQSVINRLTIIVSAQLNEVVYKLITVFTNNPVLIINIFYLLTFPLAAITFYYVTQYLRINKYIGIAISVSYSSLYYHFYRNVAHLSSSAYFVVPLYILVLLMLFSAVPPFFTYNNNCYRLNIISKKSLFIIMLLLFGFVLPYYILFFYLLAFCATIVTFVRRKNAKVFVSLFIITSLVCLGYYKNTLASYFASKVIAHNDQSVNDVSHLLFKYQPIASYGEEEINGLKFIQLLLPNDFHRVDTLKNIKESYNKYHQISENTSASLGILASIGLMFLLMSLLTGNRFGGPGYYRLGALLLPSLLIANVGGLSSLVSTFFAWSNSVNPLVEARCYNRISIFIAAFALLAIGVWLSSNIYWVQKKVTRKWSFISGIGITTLLLCFIWLDQTPSLQRQYIDERKQSFEIHRDFFKKIEDTEQKNARIFQLPALVHHTVLVNIPMPWHKLMLIPPQGKQFYYSDHLLGYIHSRSLCWTFGASNGTPQANWYLKAASLLPRELSDYLVKSGFNGIYIDTHAYGDDAKDLINNFKDLIGMPIISNDNRFYYFSFRKLRDSYIAQYGVSSLAESQIKFKNEIENEQYSFLAVDKFDFVTLNKAYGLQLNDGWNDLEKGRRWTTGHARVFLKAKDSLSCNSLAIHLSTGEVPTPIRVLINGENVYSETSERNKDITINVPLSKGQCLDTIKLDLISKPWVPSNLGIGTDGRTLGLSVYEIAIK